VHLRQTALVSVTFLQNVEVCGGSLCSSGPVILTPESIPARSEVIGAEESKVEGGQDEGGTVTDAQK
jgi:hypothetical protein